MAKTLSDLEKRIAERSAELRTVLATSKKSLANIKQISDLAKLEGIEDAGMDRVVSGMEKALNVLEESLNEPITKK